MVYYISNKVEIPINKWAIPTRKEKVMAEKKLTDATLAALATLKELGGKATFADVKAAGAKVGTSNMTALVNAGLVTAEKVVKTKVVEYEVNEYTVVETAEETAE